MILFNVQSNSKCHFVCYVSGCKGTIYFRDTQILWDYLVKDNYIQISTQYNGKLITDGKCFDGWTGGCRTIVARLSSDYIPSIFRVWQVSHRYTHIGYRKAWRLFQGGRAGATSLRQSRHWFILVNRTTTKSSEESSLRRTESGGYLLSHNMCSTIGVAELNDPDRNGKGWDLSAITTLV